jgi:eukaryotic-like serine/threonine-protein kinase
VTADRRWQHVKELFGAALDVAPAERSVFLRQACRGDAALQSEVEALLANHERAGGFAERPAIEKLTDAVLRPGDVFGPYVIAGTLGVGGMGEVYRAHDARLQREVALKVLPSMFSSDPERLARFDREAQVLAALNHPHIAHLYGLEETDGVRALVLELVEGTTLADRIAQGAIAFEDAVPIARQVAEALDAAHNQGIIHRDLKPSNIKLTPDQTVKVLDFGLARALEPPALAGDMSQSPTITRRSMIGVRLGTAAYMSPEQAKGHAADRRSDVWAFGCVLYEMLTGKRAFEGEDISDTFAAILRGDPDWSALPANVPSAVIVLIKECLAKDQRERIAGMSAALFVLNERELALGNARELTTSERSIIARYPKSAAVILLLFGAVTAAALLWSMLRPRNAAREPAAQFAITLGPNQQFSNAGRHLVALSPSGTHLVYVADGRLYLRPLDRLEATPIPGVEGRGLYAPRGPFFSPDGKWIAFWQGGLNEVAGAPYMALKKVSVTGGAPYVICAVDQLPFGASWAEDDTILIGGRGNIWRVPAAGGKLETLVKLGPGELAQKPQLLPGGHAVLFTLLSTNLESGPASQETSTEDAALGVRSWDEAQVVVQSLATGSRQVLLEGATDGRYVPSGHIVFSYRETLFGVPFDPMALKVTGSRVPVVEDVAQAPGTGAAQFTFSQTGVFAYVPGDFAPMLRTLAWVDRQGRETAIDAPARDYTYPRVSPDGSRVAVTVFDGRQEDVWIWDLAGKRFTRLTSDPADDRYSEWTPNGHDIVFASQRGEKAGLWRQPADGGTADQLVATPTKPRDWLVPSGVSSDNTRIIPTLLPFGGGSDLFQLQLAPPRRLEPLLHTPFAERSAEISPDSRWLAYQSTESGRFEIYVRRADALSNERWLVSSGGGQHALWGRNGRELFYAEPRGGLMRVPVEPGPEWKAGTPMKLLGGPYIWTIANFGGRLYDISPDGQRFLVLKSVDTPQPSTIVVAQNWFEDLQQRAPTPR